MSAITKSEKATSTGAAPVTSSVQPTITASVIEQRYRRFLLILVELMCIGTVIELWLAKHTKETLQFVPFALCVLAFVSVLAVLRRPNRNTIQILRVVMVIVILGSLAGGVIHLHANYEFQTEMRPNVAFLQSLLTALSGAAPLLAPGLLGLAGVLALAATYYHPQLVKRTDS
ncbi:MAG: hypothetical protein KF726_22760 [Anaerolineae bacterium]|nr:hypothetical protein [Anaerolineae bacterium]